MVLGVKQRRLARQTKRLNFTVNDSLQPVISYAIEQIKQREGQRKAITLPWLSRIVHERVEHLRLSGWHAKLGSIDFKGSRKHESFPSCSWDDRVGKARPRNS